MTSTSTLWLPKRRPNPPRHDSTASNEWRVHRQIKRTKRRATKRSAPRWDQLGATMHPLNMERAKKIGRHKKKRTAQRAKESNRDESICDATRVASECRKRCSRCTRKRRDRADDAGFVYEPTLAKNGRTCSVCHVAGLMLYYTVANMY